MNLQENSCCSEFIAKFFKVVELELELGINSDVVKTIQDLKLMNKQHKKVLLKKVLKKFIHNKMQKILVDKKVHDKHILGYCILLRSKHDRKIQIQCLKHSKCFTMLNDFFMLHKKQKGIKEEFFRSVGLPQNKKVVANYFINRLNIVYNRYFISEKTTLILKQHSVNTIIKKFSRKTAIRR